MAHWWGKVDRLERGVEAGEMRLEIDELPVAHRRHFVDAVAEQEGPAEDRDFGPLRGHIAPVARGDAGQFDCGRRQALRMTGVTPARAGQLPRSKRDLRPCRY